MSRRDPFASLHPLAEARLAGFARQNGVENGGAASLATLPRHARLGRALEAAIADLPADAFERDAAEIAEALVQAESSLAPHVALLGWCCDSLAEVLGGSRSAADILFPGGEMHRTAGIFHGTPWSDHFDALAAEAVACAADALLSQDAGPIRITEIGAGTGGASQPALAALRAVSERHGPACFTYHYTDLSPGFLAHGRTVFADSYPEVRFEILDIQEPVDVASEAHGTSHVVLAANVLHTTRRIDEALANIATVLRPGGLLVLNELTAPSLFTTLTFGLLDDWWRFEDDEARLPHAPLLDATRWQDALKRAGFAEVLCFGQEGPGATDPQSLLLADLGAQAAVIAPQPEDGTVTLLETIAETVAGSLGLDRVEVEDDRPLAELGVDSIVAGQLAATLSGVFGVEIQASALYDHPSVAALALHAGTLGARPRPFGHTGSVPEASPAPIAIDPTPPVPPEREPASASARQPDSAAQDIAVIGMACRFPGSPDLDTFWRNLLDGHCGVTEVPPERWDWRAVYSENRQPGWSVSRWGGFLDGADQFDPEFFQLTHNDARAMSPQQRVFLETAWHALEDAGHGDHDLRGRSIGLYVGVAPDGHGGARSDARSSLGDSNAILSARLSYLLDLKGASMPIDTACSSSLVAIHLAARALADGDGDMALAGGVSILMNEPRLHKFLSDSGMASPTGLCRTFDAAADGFVPGEGVGVVVLRRLADAVADGDRIHAVIKGTGINQDGRTSGITAPSGPSQTRLLRAVHRRFGLDSASIAMVEAHGTGTQLGDPIEVRALKQALAPPSAGPDATTRWLGSVKSNIGHTLTAAGIAGFLKAALAVKHGMVPPSLHFETPNPEIDLEDGGFRVPTTAEPWPGSADGAAPRRAAVSSFGFSGTNAHAVLEEPPSRPPPPVDRRRRLVVISAKSEDALTTRLEDFAKFLETSTAPFAWIAYTATVGRSLFAHRAAIISDGVKDLGTKVRALLEGRHGTEHGISGRAPAAPSNGDGLLTAMRAVLADKPVDLPALFAPEDRHRVTLPLTRFAHTRFPAPDRTDRAAGTGHDSERLSAPHRGFGLIAANESTVDGLRYRLVNFAETPDLADHRNAGAGVFPATGILDAMWSAATLARGRDAALADPVGRLEGLEFVTPLPLTPEMVAHVRVRPVEPGDPAGALRLELVSGNARVHARAIHQDASDRTPSPPPPVDIPAVTAGHGARVPAAEIYRELSAVGFDYGPSFRTVDWLSRGKLDVLAKLKPATNHLGGTWPVALVDGAIQAAVGLSDQRGDGAPINVVPAGIDSVRLHGPLERLSYALVSRRLPESGTGGPASGGRLALDIRLLDDDGAVLGSVDGLTATIRPAKASAHRQIAPGTDADAVLGFEPYWRPTFPKSDARSPDVVHVIRAGASSDVAIDTAVRSLEPAQTSDEWCNIFNQLSSNPKVISHILDLRFLSPDRRTDDTPDPWADLAEVAVEQTIALISGWLQAHGGRPLTLLLPYRHDGRVRPDMAALEGIAATLRHEAPKIRLRLVGLDAASAADPLKTLAGEWNEDDSASHVLRWGARRSHRSWRPVPLGDGTNLALPDRPVILVTGGTGVLGFAAAEHLAAHRRARLALISRSPDPARQVEQEARIRDAGGDVVFIQADIADAGQTRGAVAQGVAAFGRIDAVLHAASATHDGLIRAKTPEAVKAVLRAKVAGTTALLTALRDQPLVAFLGFGSLAAVFGNAGQADYAAANAFLAALAEREGSPLSVIDWPHWRDGGLAPRDGEDRALRAATGSRWIERDEGLRVLDQVLASGRARIAVAAGEPERIAAAFAAPLDVEMAKPYVTEPAPGPMPMPVAAKDQAFVYLRNILHTVTGTPEARLTEHRTIEDLGLDSMHVMSLNEALERDLGRVSPTLFYEYPTLGDIAVHLAAAHADVLGRTMQLLSPARSPVDPETGPAGDPSPPPAAAGDDPVAIIGLAGRFPEANTLDAFWDNLLCGRDCVREIPEDRWSSDGVFDPTPGRPGKSYSRWGGFLDQVDQFDPLFFGIAPNDAGRMDPQERLVLETTWQALEDAALTRDSLAREAGRRGGVFIGVMYGDYQILGAEQHSLGNPVAAAAPYWSIANRVSYALDLHGPSLAVDSACSSSLTALHLACRSLWSGETTVAIAGGVNLSLHPLKYVGLSQGRFAATDGRCRSFAEGGDGYVPGEGVGIAILKPLSQALADGDPVHAVIRGSAINHGGRTNGYTVPSPRAQADAIGAALADAGLEAGDIDYIEAHGTGTALGDPIEVEGLSRVLDTGADDQTPPPCPFGTVKSSIGHLEAAAGIAGLAKVVLQFRHRKIAPTLMHGPPNPSIDFAAKPLRLITEAEPWAPRRTRSPLIAGISSFGAGGANAHLLVEEPPAPAEPNGKAEGPFAFVFSGRNRRHLDRICEAYAAVLETEDSPPADIAATLQQGREAMLARAGFLASSLAEAATTLRRWLDGDATALLFHEPDDEAAPDPAPPDADASLEAALAAWVKGTTVDWNTVAGPGRRRHFPPRPFLRRRYWPEIVSVPPAAAPTILEVSLDEAAVVLREHAVGGQVLAPATLLLELARRTLVKAGQDTPGLKNVVFPAPALPRDGHLTLRARLDGTDLTVMDGAGRLVMRGAMASAEILHAVSPLPTIAVPETSVAGTVVYDRLRTLGLTHGPSFQRLRSVNIAGDLAEAVVTGLADLESAIATSDPTAPLEEAAVMLDGALHPAAALIDPEQRHGGGLPYRLDLIAWPSRRAPTEIALTRLQRASTDKFDIDALTAEGEPIAQLRGLTVRAAPGRIEANPVTVLKRQWREAPAVGATQPGTGRLLILHGDDRFGLGADLADAWPDAVRCRWDELSRPDIDPLDPRGGSMFSDIVAVADTSEPHTGDLVGAAQAAETLGVAMTRLARAILRRPSEQRPSRLRVVTMGLHEIPQWRAAGSPSGAVLPAIARSLAAECPDLALVLIDLDPVDQTAGQRVDAVLGEPAHRMPVPDVAWRGSTRLIASMTPVALEDTGAAPASKSDSPAAASVSVIIGGGGGLGRALAARLATVGAGQVIVIGRRDAPAIPLPEGVDYHAADILEAEALDTAIRSVIARHGAIHRLYHLPLVLRDASLARMDEATFLDAFRPKALGTAHVLRAARAHEVREAVIFSSANAFAGAAGQANYVAGTAVQDALATRAGQDGPPSVRIINWGLWGEIGSVADPATQMRLTAAGIHPIAPGQGFDLLDRVLGSSQRQIAAVKATPEALTRLGFRTPPSTVTESPPETDNGDLGPEVDAFDLLQAHGRARFACFVLDRLGTDWRRAHTRAALARRLDVTERHRDLAAALIDMLVRDGVLDERDGVLRAVETPDGASQRAITAVRALEDAAAERPWLDGPRALLDAVLDDYGGLLAGTIDPLAVLFPGGTMERIERAYRGNPVSDAFNRAAAKAIAEHRRRTPEANYRILEIGAGTGGASAAVLSALDHGPAPDHYLYTDLSPRFLDHGQRTFGASRSWFSTALFNAEASLEENRQTPEAFDAVIASNVLHATDRPSLVLSKIAELLRGGGILVMNELTQAQDYATLVFGLTEGWWRSGERENRIEGSPILTADAWTGLLTKAGFEAVQRIDFAAHGGRGQTVFVAKAEGTRAVARPGNDAGVPPAAPTNVVSASSTTAPRQALLDHLRRIFTEVLKLDPEDMRAGDRFDDFGLESLTAMRIRDRLDEQFGDLSQTLLFEFETLASLADHLLAARPDKVRALFGPVEKTVDGPVQNAASATTSPPVSDAPPVDSPASTSSVIAPSKKPGAIAIIGMACRFPGAPDTEAFWSLIRSGDSAITEVPADRWPLEGWYSKDQEGAGSYTKWGGFIDDMACFDPLFFGISPAEAHGIDPQERLFLQTAWHAMEDSANTPEALSRQPGGVGVFVGAMNSGYEWLSARSDGSAGAPATTARWSIANRLSYVADFSGPSMVVDTACSSSLVALHLAVRALRDGDCGAAIAGGVNLIVHPRQMSNLCEARMLSHGRECRAFAEDADGFVDGEGVGAVMLKPLTAAERDGDRILAVIEGTAVNSGAKTSGFSVPNPAAQSRVLTDALADAGARARDLGFIETHGTGTRLGDPIEITGISQVLAAEERAVPLPIGAVKANVGHLESAAGIAGVIKTVLQINAGQIAPLRHAANPNPLVDFAAARITLPDRLCDWPLIEGPDGARPALGGVSSFGAGGMNAHVILRAPDPAEPDHGVEGPNRDLLLLSAADDAALRRVAKQVAPVFADAGEDRRRFHAVCHTLRIGRRGLSHRAALLVSDAKQAVTLLNALAAGERPAGILVADGRGSASARLLEDSGTGESLTAELARAGELGKLAALWCDGLAVNWRLLPWTSGLVPVSLPGYPFAREHYWITEDIARTPGAPPAPAPEPRMQTRFMRVAWQAPPMLGSMATETGTPVLFGGPEALSRALGAEHRPSLSGGMNAVRQVLSARDLGGRVWIMDLGKAGAGARKTAFLVLAALFGQPRPPSRILFLHQGGGADRDGLGALLRSAEAEGLRPWTGLLLADTSVEDLGIEGLAGDVRHVLSRPERGASCERRNDGLRIWNRTWTELVDHPTGTDLRRGGRYLLVGGLGEVGRALAAYLLDHWDATVAILGRRRETGAVAALLNELDPTRERLFHATGDLLDEASLRAGVADLRARMGGIDGVIDLARVIDNAPLSAKTLERFEAVTSVKNEGTETLDRVLAEDRLEFFVAFSSLAAWFGLAGGADYAAACAIQEGLIRERAARRVRGERSGVSLSVAWPQWRYDAELTPERLDALDKAGLSTIDIVAGMDILRAALRAGDGVIAAVTGTPETLDRFVEPEDGAGGVSDDEGADLAHLSDTELADYVALLRETANRDEPDHRAVRPDAGGTARLPAEIRSAFSAILALDRARIGDGTAFSDLGLDSIKALHVAERLADRLDIAVEPVLFFDHPTVPALAAVLAERISDGMREAGE